jgi:glutamyl-tRNA synthetase
MAAEFDLARVNKNSAQFDARKLEAINGDKIRGLTADEFASRITPFLSAAELISEPPSEEQAEVIAAAGPLIQERIGKLTEAVDMLGFLLVSENEFTVDPEDAARALTPGSAAVLAAATAAVAGVEPWTAEAIDGALRAALVEKLGLKPRAAFAPVRVAITGRRVSPPLFESIELLGRERATHRLERASSAAG